MFQLESYSLSRRFTVAMGLSRQPCWAVRGSSKIERSLGKGMSHSGPHRGMSILEFSAPPRTASPLLEKPPVGVHILFSHTDGRPNTSCCTLALTN